MPPKLLNWGGWILKERIMEVIIKKWGNSAAVRIPASVMVAAHVNLDQAVEVREEQGRIVIEPVRRKAALPARTNTNQTIQARQSARKSGNGTPLCA
jgi:antitoxin component of MazEF toxin-antitoxin module